MLTEGDVLVHTENSFVAGDVNDRIALDVEGGAATVLDTTLGAGFGTSALLRCTAGATVDVRNSLLVSRSSDDELA